ncbi:bifunctional 5,10-methylenetetrahydrofolate dehydrogenase/5,10-methenyltetrahydrofolate cyclohydrolase, partial [Mycoplasma nasistruthionis]
MQKLLVSKDLAKRELAKLKEELESFNLEEKLRLGIIQVGDNPASNKYIQYKMKVAEQLGIQATLYKFADTISQDQLLKKMDRINEKEDGIIVQLPLPEHIPTQVILDAVPYEKDIDGLTTKNAFRLYNETKDKHFIPATARGVLELMEYYNIDVKDKKVCVVGRSAVVGKPLAHIIKRRGANVST